MEYVNKILLCIVLLENVQYFLFWLLITSEVREYFFMGAGGEMESREKRCREKGKKCLEGCLLKEGAFLTSGVKYGTDFLVYLGEPGSVHSSFTASADETVPFKVLSGLIRVSSSTKKDFVLFSSLKEPHLFTRFRRFFL